MSVASQASSGVTRSPTSQTGFDWLDLGLAIARRFYLLLFLPLIAGALALVLLRQQPSVFTSTSYLSMTDATARATENLIRSPAVLSVVAARFVEPADAGQTPEARDRAMNSRVRMTTPPGDVRKTANVFRLEVDASSAVKAQAINNALIDTWLDLTKPRPAHKALLDANMERLQAQLKSVNNLIERLEKEAQNLVLSSSLQGELATPLTGLLQQRERLLAAIVSTRNELQGTTRDIILSPPSLPTEPTGAGRSLIAAAVALATGLIALGSVVISYLLRVARANPSTGDKVREIQSALMPFRRGSADKTRA